MKTNLNFVGCKLYPDVKLCSYIHTDMFIEVPKCEVTYPCDTDVFTGLKYQYSLGYLVLNIEGLNEWICYACIRVPDNVIIRVPGSVSIYNVSYYQQWKQDKPKSDQFRPLSIETSYYKVWSVITRMKAYI